jgi:hypothetical protein
MESSIRDVGCRSKGWGERWATFAKKKTRPQDPLLIDAVLQPPPLIPRPDGPTLRDTGITIHHRATRHRRPPVATPAAAMDFGGRERSHQSNCQTSSGSINHGGTLQEAPADSELGQDGEPVYAPTNYCEGCVAKRRDLVDEWIAPVVGFGVDQGAARGGAQGWRQR